MPNGMNGRTEIEHQKEDEMIQEKDLSRSRRRDVIVLLVVIILSAVFGYLFISHLNGIFSMLGYA